jgi:hypothetical protein
MSRELESDSVSSAIEDTENRSVEEVVIDETSLPDAIREIAKTLFEKYPLKSAKISSENAKGMKTAAVTNNFLEECYGVRLTSLDSMIFEGMNRNMSIDGAGDLLFIEALGKINASFQASPEPKLTKKLF